MAREVIAPTSEGDAPEERDGRGALRFLKELPVLVVLALGIALLIKAFLVQAFYIPSASMEPTLTRGDRVLVNKLSYRFGEPARGDVVVFHDPYPDPCDVEEGRPVPRHCNQSPVRTAFNWVAETFGLPTGETKDFIKRIVALPGETVQIHEGEVYVCEDPGCRPLRRDGTIRDGHKVTFASTARSGPRTDRDNQEPFRIPDDQYYVLGDNRANSSDSRSFQGIDADSVVGKAFVVVWPPTRFGGL